MLEESGEHIEKTGLKEWLWFFALWALGFSAILIVGGFIKLLLRP